MTTILELCKSERIKLPYLSLTEFRNKFDKGWSYFYVYYFREIRDIYLAVREFGYSSLKSFTNTVINVLKIRPVDTEWDTDGRRILEHINALISLGLLNKKYEIVNRQAFLNSTIGDDLSLQDKQDFKFYFFRYYRFKEILSWFINPFDPDRETLIDNLSEESIKKNSNVLYTYSKYSRFSDSFIFELENNTPIYYIDRENEDFMRFWDVFLAWTKELGLIEKFNLKNLDYRISDTHKSLTCVYFINSDIPRINLLEFIKTNYKSKYINVPKLVFKLCVRYRLPIDMSKTIIVSQCKESSDKISMQRTSEVFIRDKTELDFVPIVKNSYISHLMIL